MKLATSSSFQKIPTSKLADGNHVSPMEFSYQFGVITQSIFSGINMIKRSQALHSLFTRGTALSDANGELVVLCCDVIFNYLIFI
jgi:hypothetical protein